MNISIHLVSYRFPTFALIASRELYHTRNVPFALRTPSKDVLGTTEPRNRAAPRRDRDDETRPPVAGADSRSLKVGLRNMRVVSSQRIERQLGWQVGWQVGWAERDQKNTPFSPKVAAQKCGTFAQFDVQYDNNIRITADEGSPSCKKPFEADGLPKEKHRFDVRCRRVGRVVWAPTDRAPPKDEVTEAPSSVRSKPASTETTEAAEPRAASRDPRVWWWFRRLGGV